VELAQGRWIAFLDDDDLWSPTKLREQLDAAEGPWVYSKALIFTDGPTIACEEIALPSEDGLLRALIRRNVLPAGCSNVIARADLVRAAGGFDTRLSQLSDWELWLRLADRAQPTACHQMHVAYRRHSGNMIVSKADPSSELDLMADKHAQLASSCGERFDRAALAHWLAAEQRRVGRRRDAFATHMRAGVRLRDVRHLLSALRIPLGDRAMALREPPPRSIPPPDWLRTQLQ
jgi:hypothetical protein